MSASGDCPIIVAGAGPTGLAMALALARSGLACGVLDARDPGAAERDPRVLALSHGTLQILESWGVAEGLSRSPILSIHVSQQGHFGRTLIRAEDCELQALGYVVEAGELVRALARGIEGQAIRVRHQVRVENVAASDQDAIVSVAAGGAFEQLRAPLVVFAEGTVGDATGVRSRDYGQHAVIARTAVARPHAGRAYERFTAHGPVALLPWGADYAVVFVTGAEEAERLGQGGEGAFLERLTETFGGRVELSSVGGFASFPLALRYRSSPVGERCVWIGNAAQTLHPVAGQGFNLALRDVVSLAETLAAHDGDPGAARRLARYAASRRVDRFATIGFTDALVRAFALHNPLFGALRGAGLLALDVCPPARTFLARRMMYGARAWVQD